MAERQYDVICMGRAAVDLYGEQFGEHLENMSSFAKYVGGSSANMAIGMSRQGCRVAMLTRVGNEHMGRFVRNQLAANGVDVSHVLTDEKRLTGLVILGIKNRYTFPLIFYRENCADMAISDNDFDADFIASASSLVITGTHFSTPDMQQVCMTAVDYARQNGTKTVLDIDYRPVLWGLTAPGEGEVRFVAAARVTAHLQSIIPLFDLIVGTEEEIRIAGGSTDTLVALRDIRACTDAVLVVKRGSLGCVVFPNHIPAAIDDGISVPGVAAEICNVLGAGDAFISGFMRGWINGEPWEQACRYANACGALVVSRHSCAPAIPTKLELDYYLAHVDSMCPSALGVKINHLHRVSTRARDWPAVYALAFDHRVQIEQMAEECGADVMRLPALKCLIAQALQQSSEKLGLDGKAGIIVDSRFGEEVLRAATGNGLWIARPIELPGTRPLAFEDGDNIGLTLRTWPVEHIVKCLVSYHPDDAEPMRTAQEKSICRLYHACVETGHELLLEIIPPSDMPRDEHTLARALDKIYALHVFPDWWKLPPQTAPTWRHIEQVIHSCDPHCRGVVLLGLDASEDELSTGFREAAGQSICKGFAVGRTIFAEPAKQWLCGQADDRETIDAIADRYQRILNMWHGRDAVKPDIR